jgi:hypothetical protein
LPSTVFELSDGAPDLSGPASLFKKWSFEPAAGGACDQDLLLRAHRASRYANIPEVLLGYREDAVAFRKTLEYRIRFAGSLLRYYRRRDAWWRSVGIGLIAGKTAVDGVAVVTGLQHRVLRHRAQPATAGEARQWADVWAVASANESS